MRNILRVGVGAAVIAATTVLTMTDASAATSSTVTRSTTGAKASCHFSTWGVVIHDDHAQINCSLSDTAADSHSVYVEWWQDGFGHVQLKNSNGSGSTKSVVDARQNGDGSFETLYFKVCRDVQLLPDNCSSTYTWKIP
jgi:hypothetical protein